jgi:hypothetical protein
MKPMSTQTIGGKQYEIVDAQARLDAAGAQTAAKNAQTTAESAQTAAENAQTTAESAQTAAENAQTTAESAQTAAENARYDPVTYSGVDLTVKFADEIANYSDVWAWIQARIKAANYDGIHVGDYIPFKTTNSVSLNAQIAGIDTYTNYGNTAVGHHIDFICKETWLVYPNSFNKVAFNNGISDDVPYPWLASNLYHFCNSLAGTVPSAVVAGGGPGTAVDYTGGGIYYYLPAALKSVIIQKRMNLPKRYSASGLLTSDNGSGWADAGYLWVPTEWEVFGGTVWGDTGNGACGSAVQYPLFAHNMKRKQGSDGWWLLSASSGSYEKFGFVSYVGLAGSYQAAWTSFKAPVCFRVG